MTWLSSLHEMPLKEISHELNFQSILTGPAARRPFGPHFTRRGIQRSDTREWSDRSGLLHWGDDSWAKVKVSVYEGVEVIRYHFPGL